MSVYKCVSKMYVLIIKIGVLPIFFGFSDKEMLKTYIMMILFL